MDNKSARGNFIDLGLLLIVGALLVNVISQRLIWIWQFQYPTSTDGFFYLQELSARLGGEGPYYQANSVFFTFWHFIGIIFNVSAIPLLQLINSSTLIIFSCAVALLLRHRPLWISAAILFLYWSSDIIYFRQYAFPKQAFSFSIFFLGLAIIESYKESDKRIFKLIGVLLLLFSALMHIYSAALALIFSVFALNHLKLEKKYSGLIAIVSTLFLAYYLSIHQKTFLASELQIKPSWWLACTQLHCSASEWREFYIFTVLSLTLLLILLAARMWHRSKLLSLSLALFILLNIPIWSDEGDMLRRLAFSSTLFVISAAVFAVCSNLKTHLVLLTVMLFQSWNFFYSAHKNYRDTKIPVETLANAASQLQQMLPKDSIILAPHGVQFAASYFLKRQAFSDPTEISDQLEYFHLRRPRALNDCTILNGITQTGEINCVLLSPSWALYKIKNTKSSLVRDVK